MDLVGEVTETAENDDPEVEIAEFVSSPDQVNSSIVTLFIILIFIFVGFEVGQSKECFLALYAD